jgi:hypothetical protein
MWPYNNIIADEISRKVLEEKNILLKVHKDTESFTMPLNDV